MQDMTKTLETALFITEAATTVSLQAFASLPRVDLKSDDSPVTEADKAIEKMIREALNKHFPQDGIFGEEFGTEGLSRPRVWVVDPIDGTKSFVSGVPLFGMLLALVQEDAPQLGIVRLPALDTVYASAVGLEPTKNGAAIATSDCRKISEATLFINEAEKINAADPGLFNRMCAGGKMRRMGYDCMPHALVAEGRIDGVFDFDLKPYDFWPLVPLIETAGGVVTDWSGKALDYSSDGQVVSAATPQLHGELLDFLNL